MNIITELPYKTDEVLTPRSRLIKLFNNFISHVKISNRNNVIIKLLKTEMQILSINDIEKTRDAVEYFNIILEEQKIKFRFFFLIYAKNMRFDAVFYRFVSIRQFSVYFRNNFNKFSLDERSFFINQEMFNAIEQYQENSIFINKPVMDFIKNVENSKNKTASLKLLKSIQEDDLIREEEKVNKIQKKRKNEDETDNNSKIGSFHNNYEATVDGKILSVHLDNENNIMSYNSWIFREITIDKIESLIPVFDVDMDNTKNIDCKKFNNDYDALVCGQKLRVRSFFDNKGTVVYGFWILERIPIEKIQSLKPVFEI
jgi:hypothetical protein